MRRRDTVPLCTRVSVVAPMSGTSTCAVKRTSSLTYSAGQSLSSQEVTSKLDLCLRLSFGECIMIGDASYR